MSERKQNWYTRFVKWFGPSLFLETGNPRMDAGGGSAFTLFGSTKRGRKFSMGMKESGIVQLNADATLEIIAGEENDDGGEDILINSRNGAIDIKVTKNGDVRISGSNVSIKADAAIDIHGRVVRIKGDDEISLQAPYIHSRGKKGNLVPKSWGQVATFGTYVGADKFDSFVEKGLQQAAGIVNEIDDLAPKLGGLAGEAGALAQGLGDALPGMQDQLLNAKDTLIPELKEIATSDAVADLGESLQGSVSNIQSALQANSGAFANFGQGLVPTGY